MESKLLVRVYNVGLGDCTYLRVPDVDEDVHILIDCGNKFTDLQVLGDAITDLKNGLPDTGSGKKRLDLLVVTIPHEEHHKGFEKAFFHDLKIGQIWLSPSFDRLNPKASGFHALQDAALRGLQSLSTVAAGNIKEELDGQLASSKDEAIDLLNNWLPATNNIQPLYVSANTPQQQLQVFKDPSTQLKVLAPMSDVDTYYLGGEGLMDISSKHSHPRLEKEYEKIFLSSEFATNVIPTNIGSRDFRLLRERIHPEFWPLAKTALQTTKNLSVVLLLEWHGRRLLFPSDAGCKFDHHGKVIIGTSNGSWNVMWQECKNELSQPIDFIKIGNHGSTNSTPWTPFHTATGNTHPINQILDTLLPLPKPGQKPTARAIVSTSRTTRWPNIPDPLLMIELGKRVANSRSGYTEDPNRPHVPVDIPQPQRTDLEPQVDPSAEKYIQIEFSPVY